MLRTDADIDKIVWFAMSAPYRRELKAKQLLDRLGIENFIPMQYKVGESGKKKDRVLVPAVHNMIFAKTSPRIIQQAKTGVSYLQYKTCPRGGCNVPIVIPDRQMEQFIAVCRSHNEHLIYLRPDEINLEKGTRVRILGGAFHHVEGTFMEVRGRQGKRVVIRIEGVAAVATAEISPDLVEVLE